jgi:hypothetical protein
MKEGSYTSEFLSAWRGGRHISISTFACRRVVKH